MLKILGSQVNWTLDQKEKKIQEQVTHCVEASVFPSGLKAAAIVDLGGGNNGQYFAEKCRNDSASTLQHN